MPKIKELNVFPVKSMRGISLTNAELTEEGLRWDRHWMVVNNDGLFVTQRQLPKMATISTELTEDALVLSTPECEPISIPLYQAPKVYRDARVWKSDCQVVDEGPEVTAWLTSVLGEWRGQVLHLVRMAKSFSRTVSTTHTCGEENTTNFADGYPLLVTSTGSLNALNQALAEQELTPVPMSRFRSNLVIDSDDAFIENRSSSLKLQVENKEVEINLCKPCERCKVITLDQHSGESLQTQQPLKTLFSMTHVDKKGAFFGQNGVVRNRSKSQLPISLTLGMQVKFEH